MEPVKHRALDIDRGGHEAIHGRVKQRLPYAVLPSHAGSQVYPTRVHILVCSGPWQASTDDLCCRVRLLQAPPVTPDA